MVRLGSATFGVKRHGQRHEQLSRRLPRSLRYSKISACACRTPPAPARSGRKDERLSPTVLALEIPAIIADKPRSGWAGALLAASAGFLALSVAVDLVLASNRLKSFRLTAQVARGREKGETKEANELRSQAEALDRRSWLLLKWQTWLFGIGAAAVGALVLVQASCNLMRSTTKGGVGEQPDADEARLEWSLADPECSTDTIRPMERKRALLVAHVESLAGAINLCMDQGYFLPTLVLIYASIDMLASLVRADGQADVTRDDYVRWVEKYLIPAGRLPCTALEVYGARCGLLHSYGGDSRLRRQGRGRLMAYARGAYSGPAEIAASDGQRLVVVHVADLFGGWHRGAEMFLSDLAADPVLAERAYRRAGGLYSAGTAGEVEET